MKAITTLFTASAAALLFAVPAVAQQDLALGADDPGGAPVAEAEPAADETPAGAFTTAPAITMRYFRAQDQRGINVFEAPKVAGAPYTGFRLDWGAAFAQQFQSLSHRNAAAERLVTNAAGQEINANQLISLGTGFNTATANLFLNAQIAPGIRVALSTYLSSRHHPEAWVKDGYLLIDESPLAVPALQSLMSYVTVKAGHFEINYGDAHFRRSDNGNAMFNPFVGNHLMDAFTTEIGGEVYFRTGPFLAMGSITGGEIKGRVDAPEGRAPSYIGKLGFDTQVTPALRVRLTGSGYTTEKSLNNTLYGGDRAGSRYYFVMENTQATEASAGYSGNINPGFRSKVTALQLNPFVKFGGLELFGVLERAEGRAGNEPESRVWNQRAVDAVYRFLPNEQLYVGGRWNEVNGELAISGADVSVDRWQLGAGWFVTPNVLLKGEYVTQKYHDFPSLDIRHGGKFDGFVVEGVVAF
jgi:hypothetical protein